MTLSSTWYIYFIFTYMYIVFIYYFFIISNRTSKSRQPIFFRIYFLKQLSFVCNSNSKSKNYTGIFSFTFHWNDRPKSSTARV